MSRIKIQKPLSLAKWIYGGLICSISLIIIVLWLSFIQSINERNEKAELYARMVEGTVSRTIESLEISLSSWSDELLESDLSHERLEVLRNRLIKTLRFAPHLRQIVIVKGHTTLVDTQNEAPLNLNLSTLGIDKENRSAYSPGLVLGNRLRGRFLPLEGRFPDEGNFREIIPIAFKVSNKQGENFLIIAALNPGYIKRYIHDLTLEGLASVYLIDHIGNSLLQSGLYGPNLSQIVQVLEKVLSSGADELMESRSIGYIPIDSTIVRLVTKYPLAVAVVTNHRGSFELWLIEKRNFLAVLLLVIAALMIGAGFIIRGARNALEMKEEVHLLSAVVEHTPVMVVITDPDGNIEYVNESFTRETGFSKSEIIGQNPRILKSGDKSAFEYQGMWSMLSSGKTWAGEFHNKHKDGSLYWERATITPLQDSDGSITHFIALKQPITEEKKAQDKIRLASTVFASANEAIMVTDTENRIQMVNKSFQQITGYDESEVINQTPSILKSGKHLNAFYDDMYQRLHTYKSWEGEIWNRRKNGEIYPEWLTISSRFDPKGQHEGYVALFSDITKRKQDEAIILHQANYDSVTSLPNRRLFNDRLKQSIALSERNQSAIAILFIDLDRFKYVNDTFGHHIGDLLLQQVAERLKAEIRKSDTVARLGGDEFSIILTNLDSLAVVEKITHKLRSSIMKPYLLEGNEAHISCSIGIALFPEHGDTAEALLVNADSAMYRAKQNGRNTHEYYNQTLSEEYKKR